MGHLGDLYHEPLTPSSPSFVGQGYFIRGQLLSSIRCSTELGVIRGNRAWRGLAFQRAEGVSTAAPGRPGAARGRGRAEGDRIVGE
ncbi:hypothetical protein P4123_15790 [Pseudomonas aeruginosa]|nr:hypothetical protein [Pseudomonas aeruginosa]